MLTDELDRGLRNLGLDLETSQRDKLLAYLDLLQRWNRRFNLTAIRDPQAMLVRHLLDSLSLVPHLRGRRLIDVGTGGGLPGVPLAIAEPNCKVTLLDSNGKKTRFLTQVKASLALPNIDIIHTRVESLVPERPYDMVLSRAFASLGDMIAGCCQLLAPGGEFLAMKGQYPAEELAAIESRITGLSVLPLSVPGLDEERCLVRFGLRTAAQQ